MWKQGVIHWFFNIDRCNVDHVDGNVVHINYVDHVECDWDHDQFNDDQRVHGHIISHYGLAQIITNPDPQKPFRHETSINISIINNLKWLDACN